MINDLLITLIHTAIFLTTSKEPPKAEYNKCTSNKQVAIERAQSRFFEKGERLRYFGCGTEAVSSISRKE